MVTPEIQLPQGVRVASRQGRWILAATILGSSVAGIDAGVVTVTLPAIGRDFGTSFTALQWTVTGYTLSLAALILPAGGLGDRYGRKRVYLIGLATFTTASVLCAACPNIQALIAGRILQGIGGALMAPASMAILHATIAAGDRPRAMGIWSGVAGVSTAIAPVLGGWLPEIGSWRWIFLINLPIAALVGVITTRHVPETRDRGAARMDWYGAGLAVIALAAGSSALSSWPRTAVSSRWCWVGAAVAVLAAIAFTWHERRSTHPMLPPSLLRSRPFVAINIVTFFAYGAFGVFSLVFTVALETVAGYSPSRAGSTLLPITIITLVSSRYSGTLAARIGPGLQLVIGPALCAAASLLALRVAPGTGYWTVVIPQECVFGLGLAAMVVPLTSVALSSAADQYAGVASAVNNAVARGGALIWISALPPAVGLTGASYTRAELFLPGYRLVCLGCAAGLVVAGAIAAAVFRSQVRGHAGASIVPVTR